MWDSFLLLWKQAIEPLALTFVTVATPILVTAMLQRLKVANAADLGQQIANGALGAAGTAYNYGMAHGGFDKPGVLEDSIAAGTNYMTVKLPTAMARAGITTDSVASLVHSRLGVLLASDPTVTAGTPAPVVATAIPGNALIPVAGVGDPPPVVAHPNP